MTGGNLVHFYSPCRIKMKFIRVKPNKLKLKEAFNLNNSKFLQAEIVNLNKSIRLCWN